MATDDPPNDNASRDDNKIASSQSIRPADDADAPPLDVDDTPGQQLTDSIARSTEQFPIVNPAQAEIVRDMKAPLAGVPWTLQQFFNGEIDLGNELFRRFPSMPLMSSLHVRDLQTKTRRGVATLTSQDRDAMIMIDVNGATKGVQYSFTLSSMLTFRFQLHELSDMDRARWLKLMRRDQGGLAFLWGKSRWRQDYLICIKRRYFTSLLAFSPYNFEAAVRMTPEVLNDFLEWLETFWLATATPTADDETPELISW